MSPQSMAALFEVMADYPGLEIVEGATDGAGRHGVGLTWEQPADQQEVTLVFDPQTHAFLGTEDTAIFEHAIVDAVGESRRSNMRNTGSARGPGISRVLEAGRIVGDGREERPRMGAHPNRLPPCSRSRTRWEMPLAFGFLRG